MNDIISIILKKYELFLLIFIRMSAIFVIAPLFSSQNIPNIFKLGFSFMLSLLLVNILDIKYLSLENNNYYVLIIKELVVGLIIGFISYAFFTLFYVLGQIVDMQIGFGMANVIDPQNKIQVPVMGNFYYILAFLIFLLMNGHHILIKALVDSYDFIPIGTFYFNGEILDSVVTILSKTFSIGFKLSSPVVVTILLCDILLGILSKTMPQMNIFVVGMPLKIIVGLIIICITIPLFQDFSKNIFGQMTNEIYKFLKFFVKG